MGSDGKYVLFEKIEYDSLGNVLKKEGYRSDGSISSSKEYEYIYFYY